ncbi:ABC transporter permease [Anoxybacterium hadale]|uniref:ABC transporter permease n=1 Tax=Anoxybacterium hadale TaxID=3408580 RepID=A0ACD1AGQ8_9FIRM|nr:ABC transporter permease [Clostridiales bacterium]
MKLSKFLINKGVTYAILLAVFYQVVMVGLFIYGYHVLPSGVNQLGINVVNQAGDQGAAIQEELVPSISKSFVNVATDKDLGKSREELNNRQIQMIIVIPENFINDLQNGKSAFDFYINESNTTAVVTTMNEVAKSITDGFNQAMNQGKLTNILKSLNIDGPQQQLIAESIQNSVVQNNIYINKAPNRMDYVMTPMFLSVATYASSMVAAIILFNILVAFIPIIGKWKAFRYVQVAGCVIALLAPLFGIMTASLFISISPHKLFILYFQQVFMQITAFQFTLIFSLALGQNGIFLNIPLLLMQTISGGGTMPLQIMPNLFKLVSYLTPMYPNIQIDFGVLFGGPIFTFEVRLLMLLIISILVLLAIVWHKKESGGEPVTAATVNQ